MCSLQGNKKINFSFLKDDIIIDNPSCQSRFTSLLHIGFHEWKLETPCQNHFQLPSIFNYAVTRLISSPTRNQCLQIVFICFTRSTFGPVKMGAHYHFKVSWVIIQISNAELKWLRLPCYHIQFHQNLRSFSFKTDCSCSALWCWRLRPMVKLSRFLVSVRNRVRSYNCIVCQVQRRPDFVVENQTLSFLSSLLHRSTNLGLQPVTLE